MLSLTLPRTDRRLGVLRASTPWLPILCWLFRPGWGVGFRVLAGSSALAVGLIEIVEGSCQEFGQVLGDSQGQVLRRF